MSVVTFKKVKHVSIGATCIAYFHASNVMYECNLITFSKYIFHSCLFLLPAFISLLPVCPLLPISTLPRTPLTPSPPHFLPFSSVQPFICLRSLLSSAIHLQCLVGASTYFLFPFLRMHPFSRELLIALHLLQD
jgi:hypothetical protein